jgi:hypothetical protein
MSSEERKAKMRAYSSQRYRRMRANIGRTVGDGILDRVTGNLSNESRAYVNRIKIEIGECVDCGLICDEWTFLAFAFDHLDRTTKIAAISKMVHKPKKYPLHIIIAEIAKCELVCHCCHAFRTYLGDHHKDQNIRPEARQVDQLTLFTTG